MQENLEKWRSIDEVAEYLGVKRWTISQWIQKRNMPAYRIGTIVRFKFSEVDEWVRTNRAAKDLSEVFAEQVTSDLEDK